MLLYLVLPTERTVIYLGCVFVIAHSGCGVTHSPRLPLRTHVDIDPILSMERTEIQASVDIRNPTSETLRFVSVRESCTCASARLQQTSISPGESTALDLTLRLTPGDQLSTNTVVLVTDSRRYPTWTVDIVTACYRPLTLLPSEIQAGPLHHAETYNASFTVLHRFLKADRHRMPRVTFSAPPELEVHACEYVAPTSISPTIYQRAVKCQMLGTASSRRNNKRHVFWAELSESPKLATRGSFTYTIVERIVVEPESVFFGIASRNTDATLKKRVVLKGTDGSSFGISRCVSDSPHVTTSYQRGENSTEHTVDLALSPDGMPKYSVGRIRIHTDHPLYGQVSVGYSALIQ